jgi:hypothetical protein
VRSVLLLGVLGALVSCADDAAPPSSHAPAVLTELLATPSAGGWRTQGDDPFEVWVCHVPADTTAPIYGGLPLRLSLTPASVTAAVSARVPAYFDELSHGAYRPVFTAGGEVTIGRDDEPQACVDAAIAGAGPTTRAVLVVADAEHGADQPGGFGSGGDPCPTTGPCPVAVSRRSAYVGASDFHPDWGDDPPMDLVEHEIGHTLGWVHSAADEAGNYLSGLDVMSNSAAPRIADPARRDGPGTLAVNLFLAGWLPAADVSVVAGRADVTLAPSNGDHGTRLVVLQRAPGGAVYTIELLADVGLNDHLPASGVAVHRIDLVAGAITAITPELAGPPEASLLQPGADVRLGDDWQLTISADWTIHLAPTFT